MTRIRSGNQTSPCDVAAGDWCSPAATGAQNSRSVVPGGRRPRKSRSPEAAWDALARLRKMVQGPAWDNNGETLYFLREAEALLAILVGQAGGAPYHAALCAPAALGIRA